MDANKIKYPIFMYNERWAWKLEKKKTPKEVTEKYCKILYKDISIIDSNLNLIKIQNIEILGKAGILGYKLGYKGLHFYVRENYELIKNLEFSETKEIILSIIIKNPSIYDSGLVIEDLLKDIRNTEKFDEIMNLLPSSD